MSTNIRTITPLDAIAWLRLIEMRGSVGWNEHGQFWCCSAPNGDHYDEGYPRTLFGSHDTDPSAAVMQTWEQWSAAPPAYFEVEIGEDEPEATERQRRTDDCAVAT
jgi:hypothetical protein